MSLTAAMNSAMSGLTAVTRATELVAGNIANASTPGYARRTLELSSYGENLGGVRVVSVMRQSDPILWAQRRSADAQVALADIRASFYGRLTQQVGAPGDAFSLSTRLADFEASLIEAASRPDQIDRLADSVTQASELAQSLQHATSDLQTQRSQADQAIGDMVDQLNTDLNRLVELNTQITRQQSGGTDISGLLDQRQQIVDDINRIVPVTVVDRPHGQISLYSEGGAILLDVSAAEIGFETTTGILPGMTIESGALSGLTLGGRDISSASGTSPLRGGALAAQFALRDEWAVEAQAELDAIARDLIERFEDPAVDATRGAGDPGLFTDNGAAFDPLNEVGLAGRIQLNAAVDPDQGGEPWHLRAGLGATGPGPEGEAGLLNDYIAALNQSRSVATGSFGTGTHTAATVSAALVAGFQADLVTAQDNQSYASGTQTELLQSELALGIDTDAELQSLIVLEQSYAANAQVLETIETLFAELIRI